MDNLTKLNEHLNTLKGKAESEFEKTEGRFVSSHGPGVEGCTTYIPTVKEILKNQTAECLLRMERIVKELERLEQRKIGLRDEYEAIQSLLADIQNTIGT